MLRSFGLTVLVVLSLFSLPPAGEKETVSPYRHSGDGIDCVYSIEAEFPLKLDFKLSAESDSDISDIRLHYVVERDSYAQVTSEVYLEFDPAASVDVQWTWDMRKTGGLPMGSLIEYWWTVEDIEGDQTATPPVQFQFNDNRYSWQSLTEDKVTIYWYQGDEPFAREIMSASQQALFRLAEDTGARPRKPVSIYLYAGYQDLLGAMVFPQEWTGGATFTSYGIIAIGIAPSNLTWGKSATIHELTHLVIYQMTHNPYSGLPTWLSEGLAMYNEGPLTNTFTTYLNRAIAGDNLLSVRSLASPFSAYAEESYLSYAQSYHLVEFLISNYGQDKMLELLNTFQEGNSYDGALQQVYGFDMDGLDALWRASIKEEYQVKSTMRVLVSSE